ncbi:uncharacterized protein K441DRAFT_674431 [Cenococcum geophilum 1.58]|uniref:uncharacterized protein n=1 Tax=Cenococcum geophilum 1.58 TaxID=794803 RepID=UPI00358E57CE|nr:hypothetical protein K441DRAFT_674431 [Cenococcum geophilum 1.58]
MWLVMRKGTGSGQAAGGRRSLSQSYIGTVAFQPTWGMAIAFEGLVVSNYIHLRSLFDSSSSGGHEMGSACWVRTTSGAVMVGDAPDADWPGEGRAPVRGGHTIREAAVPSSPGLKGINLEPLPGCRAPWRSARVRGTGWWCLPLFTSRMPLSAIAAELWGTCLNCGQLLVSTYQPIDQVNRVIRHTSLFTRPPVPKWPFRIRYAIGYTQKW